MNNIISIMVNGAQVEGVEGVRGVVFSTFVFILNLFVVNLPGVGDISFKFLSNEEGSILIIPFSEEKDKLQVGSVTVSRA